MTPVMQVTDVRVAENSIECMMSETVSWMRAPTLALLRLGMHPGVRRCPWGQQVLRRIAAGAMRLSVEEYISNVRIVVSRWRVSIT